MPGEVQIQVENSMDTTKEFVAAAAAAVSKLRYARFLTFLSIMYL